GIPFPAAIAVGFDGVWLGAPPNLLFVPDRDGDDVADTDDIEIRLTGWGIRDRHETLNSFHWGPDGWLYGCQGFATPSLVGKPAGKGKIYKKGDPFPKDIPLDGPGTPINGGVFRYHPTKDRFEVVAHGFSNPWGIDFNAKGQCFITACVIPHLWHVIPGGVYHRQGGKHYNPYVYQDIRTIADHRHRSAHGGARVYLADAFPEDQHGRIFMANIHEHAVLTDILTPKGSGYVGEDGEDFLLANNAQWVGFSMEIGPEGGVYVLDWHDADICGKEVLNKETGRVFRIMPEQSLAEDWPNRYADLNALSDVELAELQLSPSAWHARRARVIMQSRAEKGLLGNEAHARLKEIFTRHANADWRLRAMWALHITGGFSS
ncbi:MAG: PVC-type heme-binding CxxCH protein, partial [Verrucomicrobiota bacterium]